MRELLLTALLLFPTSAQLQTGVVTGQLSSKDGSSVSGIRVSVMPVVEPGAPASTPSTLVSSAMTDNIGRFRIENVPPGRYYVTAGLVQQPTYYPGLASVAGATAISVSGGATVTGINFGMVVPPVITVQGRVVTPLGVARGNLRVSSSGIPFPGVPVAPDGSFVMDRVRPGTYSLNVTGLLAGTQAQPITFTAADRDIDGIEILVLRTVAVSGRVMVEGGGPRPGFQLSFASFKGGATNPSGSFFLPTGTFQAQLPEGEYRVSWSALSPGYVVKSILAGSTDLLTNPLVVSSGSPPPQIVATLGVSSPPPWVRVSGRVVGAPRGSQLSLAGTGGMDGLSATIDPDGSFEFPTVLPGTYQARILPVLPVQLSPVFVPAKDVKDLQIVLPPMREIPGRVVIEGGAQRPLSLQFVLNNPAGGSLAVTAAAQADGMFKVTMPEGERRVSLSVPGLGFTVKSATFGTMNLLLEAIKVSAAGTEELRVTLASTGGLIGVIGGVIGGVGPGVPGGVLGAILNPQPVPREIARVVEEPAPQRVPEQVLTSSLAYHPEPAYPAEARQGRITGTVVVNVTVDRTGKVTDAQPVSGPAELRQAAVDAVKQWQYKPITVNGLIAPVIGTVTVTFSLR